MLGSVEERAEQWKCLPEAIVLESVGEIVVDLTRERMVVKEVVEPAQVMAVDVAATGKRAVQERVTR